MIFGKRSFQQKGFSSLLCGALLSFLSLPTLANDSAWFENRTRELEIKQHLVQTELPRRKIVGIEIILAGSSVKAPESFLGHTSLRLVDADDSPMNDIVIGYGADIDEPEMKRLKAANGGYQIGLDAVTFQNYSIFHLGVMQRTIFRYPLISTPEQIQSLIRLLTEHSKESPGPYRLINNNCVGRLVQTLQEAGYPIRSNTRIPLQLGKLLLASGLLETPPRSLVDIGSLNRQFRPYLKKDASGNFPRIKDLASTDPLRFLAWFTLDAQYITSQNSFGPALLNKPKVNLLALPLEKAFSVIPYTASTYTMSPEAEKSWKKDSLFQKEETQNFCWSLNTSYWRPSFPTTLETRNRLLELYQANCLK